MAESIRFHVEPRLVDAALVMAFGGWNDAGESATHAVRYLDECIQAVPLADVDGDEFLDFTVQRPSVRLDPSGERVVEWPRTAFRYGSVHAGRELVLGSGVEPHLRWRRYADLVAALVARLGIREVVLLGAYQADVVYSRPVGVAGFASTPARLEKHGVPPTGYQGPTGIVGVLAERLSREGVELLSLWAALPHYIPVSPNPRGALALLQKLVALLGIAVDTAPLQRAAADFEQRISAMVAADPELGEYVRQLKRRDFAQ